MPISPNCGHVIEKYLSIEVGFNSKIAAKLFKLHELKGGSNIALAEVIEEVIINNVDKEIKKTTDATKQNLCS